MHDGDRDKIGAPLNRERLRRYNNQGLRPNDLRATLASLKAAELCDWHLTARRAASETL